MSTHNSMASAIVSLPFLAFFNLSEDLGDLAGYFDSIVYNISIFDLSYKFN